MALTQTILGVTKNGGRLVRFTEQGSANADLTSAMSAPGANWKLILASVVYSDTPTQAGAVVTLDSGAGSAFDTPLRTGSANAQTTVYPDHSEGAGTHGLVFGHDDGLAVTAPAGGAGITAAVSIYIEVL